MPIALPSPQVLEITGSDALAFAHAQFASDVRALAGGHWQWSAWLSAQGRVRAFFRLVRAGDERLVLILRGGSAESVRMALAPFVFRAKVQMRAIQTWHALGFERSAEILECLGAVPQVTAVVMANMRIGMAVPGPELRWYVLAESPFEAVGDNAPEALSRWFAADIAAGIVEVDATQEERFLPTWIGLDRLGAVSVRKGCYPGQEIVARLHFKGGNKRWLRQLTFSAEVLPIIGAVLKSKTDAAPGELLAAAWTGPGQGIALAVLPELPPEARLTTPDMPGASFRVVSAVDDPSD